MNNLRGDPSKIEKLSDEEADMLVEEGQANYLAYEGNPKALLFWCRTTFIYGGSYTQVKEKRRGQNL